MLSCPGCWKCRPSSVDCGVWTPLAPSGSHLVIAGAAVLILHQFSEQVYFGVCPAVGLGARVGPGGGVGGADVSAACSRAAPPQPAGRGGGRAIGTRTRLAGRPGCLSV